MLPFPARFAAQADLGLRSEQEDALLTEPELGLFAIADAMGAGVSGRPAADLALSTLHEQIKLPSSGTELERLVGAVQAASAAVFARTHAARIDWDERDRRPRSGHDPEIGRWLGAGTTIVALLFAGDCGRLDEGRRRAAIVHVGDSRAYRLRDKKIEQLTVDHRLVDDARRAGLPESEIEELPAGVIVEALGIRAEPRIERLSVDIEPGDLFLLCSDGLSDALDRGLIERILLANDAHLDAGARALVEAAVAVGRSPHQKERLGLPYGDNVTVILARAGR